MTRVYNFCSGPAMLPVEVLEQAQSELLDYQGMGASIMEMSHRSKEFVAVHESAIQGLRDLLSIPDNYEVLFLQGGATSQFSMIPLNLMGKGTADYINTGAWSKKAIAEAKRFGAVNVAASTESDNFTYAPTQEALTLTKDAAYVHFTPNETIGGVEFNYVPETNGVPLVADMSSTILSHPIDVSQYGLIYAGAQKNIGPSGLTIVIVRKDLLGNCSDTAPKMYDYKVHADNGSMLNTPPTYGIYLADLVFKWLKAQGGVEAIATINARKAQKLYDYIDQSSFYANPVRKDSRSKMNVPFTLANADLEDAFLEQSDKQGLQTLAGHRSVGGMRASIYNAMPEAGIDALIAFMKDFELANAGK
jgi:phosphoserine aminotransferase